MKKAREQKEEQQQRHKELRKEFSQDSNSQSSASCAKNLLSIKDLQTASGDVYLGGPTPVFAGEKPIFVGADVTNVTHEKIAGVDAEEDVIGAVIAESSAEGLNSQIDQYESNDAKINGKTSMIDESTIQIEELAIRVTENYSDNHVGSSRVEYYKDKDVIGGVNGCGVNGVVGICGVVNGGDGDSVAVDGVAVKVEVEVTAKKNCVEEMKKDNEAKKLETSSGVREFNV